MMIAKIRRALKRLDDLRHVEEDPAGSLNHLNRRWRYHAHVGVYRRSLQAGLDFELVRFEGKPIAPRQVCSLTLSFWPHPGDWEIGAEHIYYDGPHCMYSLGPIRLYRSWGWCTKCMPE